MASVKNSALYIAAIVLIVFFVYAGIHFTGQSDDELLFYCGAGLRPVADELVEIFTERTGIRIRTDYNASNLLLGRIQISKEGDLFMPGDRYYVDEAKKGDLIYDSGKAAAFVPVIMVEVGNPKNIKGLRDLVRPGLKLGLADERTAAVGRIAWLIFEKNDIPAEEIKKNLVYDSVTVHDLATAVALGHIDAAVVWEPVAVSYEEAEVVRIPAEDNIFSHIPIAVLTFSGDRKSALKFMDFVLSEEGRSVFEKHNYTGAGSR